MNATATISAALDPTRLLTAAGLEPDDWQRELLLEPWDRALLNVTRQGGKSTTVAADDDRADITYVLTVYEPDPDLWTNDFRKKQAD